MNNAVSVSRPGSTGSPLAMLRLLRNHFDLLVMLTWRDISIKYKQSVMGLLWAILMPMLIVSAGILVKVGLAKVGGRPVEVSEFLTVTLKALPWSFFVASLRFGTISLASNMNLVTKIAFPRAVFPIAAVLSQLADFLVASSLVVVLLILSPTGASLHLLWVPLLLVLLIAQLFGLTLLLSAANLFFRDVKYLVEVVVTFAIFFTPVFYEVELFGRWGDLLMLNPVAPILEGLNDCIVGQHAPPLAWVGYSAGVALLLIVAGPMFFQRLEPKFAEVI